MRLIDQVFNKPDGFSQLSCINESQYLSFTTSSRNVAWFGLQIWNDGKFPTVLTMLTRFPILACFPQSGFISLILLPTVSGGDLPLQTQHRPASAISLQLREHGQLLRMNELQWWWWLGRHWCARSLPGDEVLRFIFSNGSILHYFRKLQHKNCMCWLDSTSEGDYPFCANYLCGEVVAESHRFQAFSSHWCCRE